MDHMDDLESTIQPRLTLVQVDDNGVSECLLMDADQQRILCCSCGTIIVPNPVAMCMQCISAKTDISEGIPKQCTLQFCRQCSRYHQPPNQWLPLELESRELLAHCLRKIRNLNKAELVAASFLWTEPHSKRIRVKITIQKEVFARAVLKQWFVVEFIVAGQQCYDCARHNSDQTWRAMVQMRQKVPHKRTFIYLEQLILKHELQRDTVKIKDRREGIDFFFSQRSHATRFCDAVRNLVPVRTKSSEQLLSTDEQNATANVRYTHAVEIAPVCKDDLLCLTSKHQRLGLRGPLVLCIKVRSLITLLDPETMQTAEINAAQYFRDPIECVLSSANAAAGMYAGMSEFLVLDVELTGLVLGKYRQAYVTVRHGKNGTGEEFIVKSHLGAVLNPGDIVRGYDITRSNYNCESLEAVRHRGKLPDIVLVQKIYSRRRGAERAWCLAKLPIEKSAGFNDADADYDVDADGGRNHGSDEFREAKAAAEYERFLRELEEDADLRKEIALYRNPNFKTPQDVDMETNDDDDSDGCETAPEVPLEELLEGLKIE